MSDIKLYQGDCLQVMQKLIEQGIKVDAVIADPPYATTALKWDSIIPLEPMWDLLNRIIKPNGIICLFSTMPFTAKLIYSNMEMYRYSWIWKKESPTNFLNANYAPLKITEDINIFSTATVGSASKAPITYFPQGVVEVNNVKHNNPNSTWREKKGYGTKNNKLNSDTEYMQKYTNYPTNILEFPHDKNIGHSTQKPVALMEYLIRTYTKEGEFVLDFCMGSGSTVIASMQCNRNCIGIEKDTNFFALAKERVEKQKVEVLF